ncbi:small ribosomal subunit protein eS17-like [Oryctolagus cuniculus]|uniref:small ribosomal subunit protein eS17-like n=1 Tax=Oryctolagus cuniculus TaxID=9986 RepID=UPI00222F1842|nr:40S ribosomal protein S17-like [Oryctolagus cuniculus]
MCWGKRCEGSNTCFLPRTPEQRIRGFAGEPHALSIRQWEYTGVAIRRGRQTCLSSPSCWDRAPGGSSIKVYQALLIRTANTSTVNKAAWVFIEKYRTCLGKDFHINKWVCGEITLILTKKLYCKIAGSVTALMGWIQEEERERRENFVPEVSILDMETIEVDPDNNAMLQLLDVGSLSNLQITQSTVGMNLKMPHGAI